MLAALGLVGCGPGELDRQQAAEEARTCASLIERVVARAQDRGLFGRDPKAGPLSPDALTEDPDAFYRALAERLATVTFGPESRPRPLSAAARFTGRCRSLLR